MRKLGQQYCPYHECVVDGCNNEATKGRRCNVHQQCLEVRCEGQSFMARGVTNPQYEDCRF